MEESQNPPAGERTDLQKHWDRFAEVYASFFTPFTTVVQYGIIVHLQLATAKRILEVGAGPGNATRLIIDEITAKNQNAPQCELVATDFSAEMVKKLRHTIEVDPKCTENLPKSITAQQADARKLPFSDGEFDRYFAGLCIQLVPEYEACIKEAVRVLTKGGMAGFSVWGREQNCTFFTVPDKIFREVLGSDMPAGGAAAPPPSAVKAHSNYDCGRDPNALIEMCKRAGFSRIIHWYAPVCTFSGLDESQLPVFLETNYARDLFSKVPEAVREERIKQVRQRLMQIAEPLIFEALCVIAVK